MDKAEPTAESSTADQSDSMQSKPAELAAPKVGENQPTHNTNPARDEPETMVIESIHGLLRRVPQRKIKVETSDEAPQPTVVSIKLEKQSEEDPKTTVVPPKNSELSECNDSETETKPSVLTLLASQYTSDSDSDSVCEVPSTQTYQNRCVEIDSDSSSSDVEVLDEVHSPIDVDILSAGQGDEDEEENVITDRSPKVRGEFHLDDLPPIQDLHITVPEEECTELGKIQSIVEQLVIVNSLPGTVPLDIDTVLFLDKGKRVLGKIFDVLGQVSDPLYCIRFNSNKEVIEKGIEVGQMVYVAPRTQHTQFVVLANLMKVRGSDASWENDVEPPERYLDYSDDEEERSARRSYRNKNRPMDTNDEAKRQRSDEQVYHNSGTFSSERTYDRNYHRSPGQQPYMQTPRQYNITGNSWHSNFYQNTRPPPQQYQNYRMPFRAPGGYRAPPQYAAHGAAAQQSGFVPNPYAMHSPQHNMQQPLFPPMQHPPPPPPGSF